MAACGGACAEWLDLVDGVVWAYAYSMCELVVQKLLASLSLLRSVVRVKEIFFLLLLLFTPNYGTKRGR